MNEELTFEIIHHIGDIEIYPTGWTRELNIVTWNGGEPKYDIREWNEDHTRMSRGITFNIPQAVRIKKMLTEMLGND